MDKKIAFLLGVLVTVGLLLVPWSQALAARGTPGSAEFGFGTHLRTDGAFMDESIRLAVDLQVDWLAIDVSWQTLQPAKGSPINWTSLETVIAEASQHQMTVVASLTHPPTWAITSNGPDSARAAQLAQQLSQKFGQSLKAIELFPGANTRSGWGTTPSPRAYLALYQAVQSALQASKSQAILVAGGLVPTGTQPETEMVDDLVYLDGLYKAGPKTSLPVISIQLADLTGTPMTAPSKSEHRVLRHYEEIREVMLNNNQERGLLWVTHLSPPSGSTDPKLNDPNQQSAWLVQSFQQMRAQLYLGATFLDALNPPAGDAEAMFSLITSAGDYHPAFRFIRDQIAQNNAGSLSARPGRAKVSPLPRTPR
jgi:hypothetical protein